MNITDFYEREYSKYSLYDSVRSIASFVDGFKPSARKVIHTLRQKPANTVKVSVLAGNVSSETQYIHGQVSLEGVIVGLAQDFTGTNNINLLVPDGSFGNRNIPESAASRYIHTSRTSIMEHIIRKDDDALLIKQEFEGIEIEPKFFLPIVPTILINGSEGIGNGFAQKILPRNPDNILKAIQLYLNKKKINESLFDIWYKGFNGEIRNLGDNKWEIRGSIQRMNTSMFNITELPIGISLQQYIKVLDKLETEKVIKSYVDRSENNTFLFEIRCEREFLKQDDEVILETLKLIKRVTENFTCIGKTNSVMEFKNVVELFNTYMDIRYEYYSARRIYLLKKCQMDLDIVNNKYNFVNGIINKTLNIFRKSKDEIYTQLESKNFYKKDDSFEYLLSMRLDNLTQEKLELLQKEIDKLKDVLQDVIDTDCVSLWNREIKELQKKLKG